MEGAKRTISIPAKRKGKRKLQRRNSAPAAPHGVAMTRTWMSQPHERSKLPSIGITKRSESCEIHRDSKKQLNVSGVGVIYEKAKSRRIRTRDALEQSGNQESAIALGGSRNHKSSTSTLTKRSATKSLDVEDLETEFEQKSFVRRASITHGLKLKQQQPPPPRYRLHRLKVETSTKPSSHTRIQRNPEKLQQDARKRKLPPNLGVSQRTQSVARNEREEHRHRKRPSQTEPISQLQERARKPQAATKKSKRRQGQQDGNNLVQQEQKLAQKSKQTQRDTKHKGKKELGKQIISTGPKRALPIIKSEATVIDLISSDSESEREEDDNDNSESDLFLALTQVLQDEAIGRGADRNEMKVYARHLLQLGLHSRQMILDAFDFNSYDLDDRSKNESLSWTTTNKDMASDIVNSWEWMKPFHKTVFYRWVWFQQQQQQRQRQRRGNNTL